MTRTTSTAHTSPTPNGVASDARRHYVFAYGSLADPLRAEAIVGRECQASFPELAGEERVTARVSRFRRETSPLAHAVPDPAGTMDGYILGPLTDDELGRLDRYEDAPRFYARDVCWAAVDGLPAGLACWIYIGKTVTRTTPGD